MILRKEAWRFDQDKINNCYKAGMKKIILLSILMPFAMQLQAQDAIKPAADSLANLFLKNYTGSIVIGIHDNGREKIFYYGNDQMPDSNSHFELGEISESFTTALFAGMIVKGIVHEDDPLQKFLPVDIPSPVYQRVICRRPVEIPSNTGMGKDELHPISFTPFICLPDPSSKPQPILLCYLGTHTSGLPDKPFNLEKNKSNPFSDYTQEDLYTFLKEYHIPEPIGFDYQHSHLGIALLGKALCLKEKMSFDSLLAQNILIPLHMRNTWTNTGTKEKTLLLTGHSANRQNAEHWTSDIFAPAAGICSTPADLMRFLAANIKKKKDLISNVLDFTHNPRMSPERKSAPEIALGWKISPFEKDKKIVWQEGITGGFSSYIGFSETDHFGVFVLSSVSVNVSDIGTVMLNKLAEERLKE